MGSMGKILDSLNQRINLKGIFNKSYIRVRIPIPFIHYEIPIGEILDPQSIDTRISRLSDIKSELESAIGAVESLRDEAQQNKEEVSKLLCRIQELEADKNTAENLLQAPQDSVIRLIDLATSKSKNKGRMEGLIIGLISGVISSLAVWFFTEKILQKKAQPEIKSPLTSLVQFYSLHEK
jgi:hypothetical protein